MLTPFHSFHSLHNILQTQKQTKNRTQTIPIERNGQPPGPRRLHRYAEGSGDATRAERAQAHFRGLCRGTSIGDGWCIQRGVGERGRLGIGTGIVVKTLYDMTPLSCYCC